MVTLPCRQRHGFDVRIFTDDHEPAHVHVFKGGNRVRVYLDPITFEDNYGFNERELRRIRRLVELHMERIQRQWVIVHRSGRT